ncbi:MAG: nicotinate-nucleotide adenylyltransferase [Pseudohongiellaceae bacterium]
MSLRIGILGGMFDPVHNGHLGIAGVAIDVLSLDQVRLIPARQPNHRDMPLCPQEQRLEMLHLAVAGDPRMIVDDRELRRPGPSYTVDTLISLQEEFPEASLVFIMGIDSFNSLLGWERWQQLFRLCHMLVIDRPGHRLKPHGLADRLDSRTDSATSLFAQPVGNVWMLAGHDRDVSSSEVRERIKNRQALDHLVPENVLRYMTEHDLYRSQPDRN